MQRSHLVVGACAAAVAGALSGAAIDTTPVERGIDGWDHIAQRQFSESELAAVADDQPSLPDHYPLITPQGRFEVGELRDRGLYRNRRFGAAAGWDDWPEPSEPAYAVASAEYRYLPDETDPPATRPASQTERPPAVLATGTEPLARQDGEMSVALPVTPRTVDVAAVLASRN
jgi:hypothetical protein